MEQRFLELKNAINDSAQMIQSQLQGIESNMLGAFVAVIAAAFISNTLGILEYWATSSFILMWIILVNSFIRSYLPWFQKHQRGRQIEKTEKTMELITESPFDRTVYLFSITAKNSVPLFRAIGITFFITFITLVIPKTYGSISVTIPIISSFLFMLLPLILQSVLNKLETNDLKKVFTRIGCGGWILIALFAFLFAGSLFVVPILSLIKLLPLYTLSLNTVALFFIVIILQAIMAITFINYFSANMVIKELTKSLFNLSNLLNQINQLTLNKTSMADKQYDEYHIAFLKAKKYEITADDSLIINFYSLAPNRIYLSTVGQETTPPENKNSEDIKKTE